MASDEPRPDQPWDGTRDTADAASGPPVEPPVAAEPPPVEPAAAIPSPAAIPPVPVEPPPVEPPAAIPLAPGGVYPPGGAYPPGVYPAGSTVLGEPVAPIATAQQPRKRGGLVAGIVAAVVVVVGLLLKFGLPILIGTAASGLLDGVFGGPFEKLPQDQQSAMEQRLKTAMGDRLEGLSDSEVQAKIDTMLGAGLPRLSEELLVDKIHLTVKVLKATDVPTCARLARSNATGSSDADAVSTAIGALDQASIARWFDINLSAIEAEAAGAPPARTAAQDDVERVFGDVSAKFSASEAAQISALYGGDEVSDADACNAFRVLYGRIEQLPPADLAIAALYDASP